MIYIEAMYIIFAIVKDSFLYRLRGMSSTPLTSTPANPTWIYKLVYARWWNDTLKRLTWAIFGPGLDCLVISHVHSLPLWCALVSIIMAYIGASFGHASVQGPKLQQNLGMGLICTLRLGMILAPFLYFKFILALYVLPLGMLAGVSYWLCYHTMERLGYTLTLFDVTLCRPAILHQGTEWGELFTGGSAFGLPLSLVIIL